MTSLTGGNNAYGTKCLKICFVTIQLQDFVLTEQRSNA